MQIVNERIKKAMESANISNEDIAKAVGIAPASVAAWFSEDYNIASKYILTIAKTLGVSPDYLLGDDSESATAKWELSATYEKLSRSSKSLLSAYARGLLDAQENN